MVQLYGTYNEPPLMLTSNRCPNGGPLREIHLQNLSHLQLVLSRSSKVKSNSTVGLSIYDVMFVCNTNVFPNLAHLRDKRF